MAEKPKEYLGDGAYVEFSGHDFKIYSSDGMQTLNEVYLEHSAMLTLIRFFNQLQANRIQNNE